MRLKKLVLLLVTIIASFLLIKNIIYNYITIRNALINIDLCKLILATVLNLSIVFVAALRQKMITEIITGKEIFYKKSLEIFLSSFFLGSVTPGQAGEFSKAKTIATLTQKTTQKCMLIPVIERSIDIASLIMITIPIISQENTELIFLAVFIAFLIGSILFLYLKFSKININLKSIWSILILSSYYRIVGVLSFLFVLQSLDIDINFFTAGGILGLSVFAGFLSYFPGGWGTREYTMSILLAKITSDNGVIAIAPILVSFVTVGLVSLIGARVFYSTARTILMNEIGLQDKK